MLQKGKACTALFYQARYDYDRRQLSGMVLKELPVTTIGTLKQHLLEGEIPVFSDTASTNKVLVSRSIADKLSLEDGR